MAVMGHPKRKSRGRGEKQMGPWILSDDKVRVFSICPRVLLLVHVYFFRGPIAASYSAML
jgi:hypothetical protein